MYIVILTKHDNLKDCDIKIENSEVIWLGAYNFANKASIFVQLSINHELINIFNCHLASGCKENNFNKRVENL